MDDLVEFVDVVQRCAKCSVATAWLITSTARDGVTTVRRLAEEHGQEKCAENERRLMEAWPAVAVLRRAVR